MNSSLNFYCLLGLLLFTLTLVDLCLSQKEVIATPGNDEFTVVAEILNFDDAARRCLERGAILAGIANKEEHDLVANLSSQLNLNSDVELWIGTHFP